MSSAIKRYGFINAKLRARLGKLLSEDYFNRLINAASMSEAVPLLKESDYGSAEQVYSKTGDLKMAELELYRAETELYKEVQSYLGPSLAEFVNSLLLRYEIESVKNATRLWFDRAVRGRDISYGLGYLCRNKIIRQLDLDGIIHAEDSAAVQKVLSGTPYAPVFAADMEQVETDKALFTLEMDLDALFYENLHLAGKKLNSKDAAIARRVIGLEIDLENIGRAVRLRMFYKLPAEELLRYTVKGGNKVDRSAISKAGNAGSDSEILAALIETAYPGFSSFLAEGPNIQRRMVLVESLLADLLQREVKRLLLGNPFTIGIILAYFILKKMEIKRLMTILNAKNYNMPAELIRGKI